MPGPHELGAFLEAGGNRVFFVNGVLETLKKEQVQLDFIVGFSASAPVLLAYLVGENRSVMTSFAAALDANRQNFYFFRSPHFPHDAIYKNAVDSIVYTYTQLKPRGSFALFAAQTKPTLLRTKSLLISIVLILREVFSINALPLLRRTFGVSEIRMTESMQISESDLSMFIMGSSGIYPFIGVYQVEKSAIVEGAMLELRPVEVLATCRKKLVIHTEQGITGERDDCFHIYSTLPIPRNALDYTNGDALRELHRMGISEAQRCVPALRSYLAA
jgi:predicted acylesterase/phospholipase RssA